MRVGAVCIITAVIAGSAGARTAWAQATPSWQVEITGGFAQLRLALEGDAALPPPGAPLTTSGPTNPTRRISTWMVGDGATLLNGTNAEFGAPGRLQPLDDALSRLGFDAGTGIQTSLRLIRHLSPRIAIEIDAGARRQSPTPDQALIDAADTTRAGFVAAFSDLFLSGPFTDVDVQATRSVAAPSSWTLTTTAAVRFLFGRGDTVPYATLGGGLSRHQGTMPSVTVQGRYRFTVSTSQAQADFEESDVLRVGAAQRTSPVAVAGFGLQQRIGGRLGLVVDARAHLGRASHGLTLEATPDVAVRTPGAFIESFTTPAVQFSSNPDTGRLSTLSGPPLQGFDAFRTRGLDVRYAVTAGLFVVF